jgi:hypothetical protein
MNKTREQAFWHVLLIGFAAMFALGFVGADLMAAASALGWVPRSMVGARLANMRQGRPTENPPIGEIKQGDTASMLNVKKHSVERARAVLDKGSPDLARRHLSGPQCDAVAAEIANIKRWTRTDLEHSLKLDEVSLSSAAKYMGRSRANVANAKAVKEKAPEVFEALKQGKSPIGDMRPS